MTVKLDFPKRPKPGAVKDVESFRKGHHTLRSSPRGVVKHRRVSGAAVVAIVLPSCLWETTTWNAKAEICFSDILSCLSGCIDHLLEANRCMNRARIYTLRAWFVAVIIVVIKAGVVVTIIYHDKQRDGEFIWVTCWFGEFPRLLPVTQVNFCIFPGGERLVIVMSCWLRYFI